MSIKVIRKKEVVKLIVVNDDNDENKNNELKKITTYEFELDDL